MTAKELDEKRMALFKECTDKLNELSKQYAIEHNPVKVGDIVADDYHTIRVERMSLYVKPIPYMKYYGTELTKQGVPKKRQPKEDRPVFQIYMESINGEPYKYEKEDDV